MIWPRDYPKRTWRTFTRAELEALGMIQQHPDWGYEHPIDCCDALVQVIAGQDSHGTADWLIWQTPDGRYWQQLFGYHHEDWAGTADLYEYDEIPAFEVEPHSRMVVEYRPVEE